ILDAVDVRANGILTVGGDALFHLRRGQTGFLPDHRDHRYSYFRKNIRWHRPDGGDAKKQDQGCDHIKRVRKSQRKSNNAHDLSLLRAHWRRFIPPWSTEPPIGPSCGEL